VLTVPQHGPVACLNSAVAGVIAMYEVIRGEAPARQIVGDEYFVTEVEKNAIRPSEPRVQPTMGPVRSEYE
jgi:hypothetical protein